MLDLQLQAVLAHAQEAGVPDLCELPPSACRGLYRQIMASGALPPADVDVQDRLIAGPGGALPLRIYSPKGIAPEGARGIVLYLHGGGFVVGDIEAYDSVCRQVSQGSGSLVVAVDYRLAPEHPFPAAVHDAQAALTWCAQHGRSVGGDPQRIAVVGDSAGGNLAAGLALHSRRGGPALRLQVLVYPVTSATPGLFPSYERNEGYVLTRKTMNWFSSQYFGPTMTAPDWRGAPLLAEDLADLPPALVLVAGYDPLRDEGVAYAEKMQAAGNKVSLIEYPGLTHAFLGMLAPLSTARLALAQISSALREALAAR